MPKIERLKNQAAKVKQDAAKVQPKLVERRASGVVYAPATRVSQPAKPAAPSQAADPVRPSVDGLEQAAKELQQAVVQVKAEINRSEPEKMPTPQSAATKATSSGGAQEKLSKDSASAIDTSVAASLEPQQPAAKPETKPAAKLEARPETKPETKPKTKPAAKAEAKPETRPAAKPETKPAAKAEARPETRPATKPAAKPKSKTGVKLDAEVASIDPDANLPLRTPRRRVLANALRMLAVDAVEQAQSGHPGMPMGMADIAEVLWRDFMRHNPQDPSWVNRDRFILSNGHGSMLLYGLLHLTGYELSRDDLKQFRQLDSKTPGHPEVGHTPGVETTTGPLGQGLANAVEMALAEAHLAARYNRRRCKVVDHFTYVFAGDGCLMEGISHEACSLAGTLGLGKLIVFWDNNGISIDGKVGGWFNENTPQRFAAYNWQVIPDVDGHKPQAIREAIIAAQQETQRPSLICCRTHIGHGSPGMVDTAQSHGAPLGVDEVAAVREELKWAYPPFEIPHEVEQAWDNRAHGKRLQLVWQLEWQEYQTYYPNLAAQLERLWESRFPAEWEPKMQLLLEEAQQQATSIATRKASNQWLQRACAILPEIIVGAADVSESVDVKWKGCQPMEPKRLQGNFIHYGVREFAMVAMANGMALHGELIPVTATYLVFSDYARNAIRMAALMQQRVIFVFSHDSLALGEDGPTHQPVEHITSLRLIPGLDVWRPADQVETIVAWKMAVERQAGPTSLILTRQAVPTLARNPTQLGLIKRGGYVIYEPGQAPEAVIMATGSEVQLAVSVAQSLAAQNRAVRVISMPCCERFMQQDIAYQAEVLAPGLQKRIAIECGVSDYWHQFVGTLGKVIGVDGFGKSAKGPEVMQAFGFSADYLLGEITTYLAS